MKKTFFLLVSILLLFSCSNDSDKYLSGEVEENNVTTRAGYRGVSSNLHLVSSLETATRLNWDFISINFVGDNIVSPIEEDFIHTDFSGTTNLPAGGALDREIIGSSYLLNLKSKDVDRIDINFYSLYAGTVTNVDNTIEFEIRVDIKGNLSNNNVLATKTYVTGASKDRPFTISVTMSGVTDQDDYYIEIYINAIGANASGVVMDMEGNAYTYRKFGNAGYWMTQNLRSTKNNRVTLVENNNAVSSKSSLYYFYPNGDRNILSSNPEYGLLYTWWAATGGQNTSTAEQQNNSSQPVIQGICPEGWHIPSDYEWNQLEQEMIRNVSTYSTTSVVNSWNTSWATYRGWYGNHGQAFKSTTAVNGIQSNGTSLPSERDGGGFNALNVGRIYQGVPLVYGINTDFWSSSSNNQLYTWRREVVAEQIGVYRDTADRAAMFSVRCKKNE